MTRQQILAFSHATHRLKQSASDDFDRKVLSNKVVVIENDDDVHFKLWTKRQGGMSRRHEQEAGSEAGHTDPEVSSHEGGTREESREDHVDREDQVATHISIRHLDVLHFSH